MENKIIIKEKHTTFENALIVENYPYGYKKTQKKYWIESVKNKGDRIVTCTLNPKTQKWNKPKKSVYYALAFLTKNTENGHIQSLTLYPTTDKTEINNFFNKIKEVELNEFQKNQKHLLSAYSKVYENVTWEIKTRLFKNLKTGEISESVNVMEINDYIEVDQQGNPINKEEEEKQQQKSKEKIRNAVAYEYAKNKGVL